MFSQVIAGLNAGVRWCIGEREQSSRDRRCVLGVVLCDEVAELFDDRVDELLSVSVRLPELCKNVVLPVALPHSTERRRHVNVLQNN